VAKPPAGSSLLFGALADSGRIKERKNGSYRMVLKDVDGINWFTDRPYRSEGIWSARKLVRGWGQLFGKIQPNSQATFKQTSVDKLLTFEMYKPVLARNGESMHFRIKPISARGKKIASSAKNSPLKEVSLFIDNAALSSSDDSQVAIKNSGDPGKVLIGANLPGVDMSHNRIQGGSIKNASLVNANLQHTQFYSTDMSGVNLKNANLEYTEFFSTDMTGADLSDSDVYCGVFDTVNLTGANLLGASGSCVVFVDVIWSNTTCPDGTNSDTNANCGFY